MVPRKLFLTKGQGTHRHRLQSFELALRDAGIASCNLVTVSSIFPPNCELISQKKGITFLHPGEITYCVLSMVQTKEPKSLYASIGIALPDSPDEYGYIAEYHEQATSQAELKRNVEELALLMLATTKGVTTNQGSKKNPDSDEAIIKRFRNQTKTESVASIIEHTNPELWSTVVAVAVFIE